MAISTRNFYGTEALIYIEELPIQFRTRLHVELDEATETSFRYYHTVSIQIRRVSGGTASIKIPTEAFTCLHFHPEGNKTVRWPSSEKTVTITTSWSTWTVISSTKLYVSRTTSPMYTHRAQITKAGTEKTSIAASPFFQVFARSGGKWHEIPNPQVKFNGAWDSNPQVYVNRAGTWKELNT